MMADLGLFLLALALGFITAIPVGGSQIEVAKRALHGHLCSAAAVTLGSVSSDVVYGAIALYGLAPLLTARPVLAAFNAAGALALWLFSFWTIRESRRPHELHLESAALNSKRWAYVTGFTLAASNPLMVLTWLYGAMLARQSGLTAGFNPGQRAVFIAGGALGLGLYQLLLASVIRRIKGFVPDRIMGRIYRGLGITLAVLSLFFVINVYRLLILKQTIPGGP